MSATLSAPLLHELQSARTPRFYLWVIFLVAVVSHLVGRYYYPFFHTDQLNHIAGAQAILAGHGYTRASVSPDDLSRVEHTFRDEFPPGVALLLLPLLKVFGDPWW